MTSTADLKHREGPGIQATIQRIVGFLAGMIMPNIAAFLAWGLITALFIPAGWWPNEQLAALVGPMILTLLPLLIGYTRGRLPHRQRERGHPGVTQAREPGKSVLFMIEPNPGPGLGILLAYWFFGPRALRPSAPGAIVIHFFGGIHELYFPLVLLHPVST